jgi:paired small multidrug resistance pump
MEWFLLVFAGLFEVLGVISLNKLSQQFSVLWFFILMGGFSISLILLAVAMKDIPMGTAYAIWTGIGTVGGVLVSMIFYNEPKDKVRIFFISLVIIAAIGLKTIS